jgi:capsid protein
MRRRWVGNNFCQPVYNEWLTEAVIRGRISAPGFFTDPAIRAAWCGAFWVGPGQGQIDPWKETRAAELKIKTRLSNHEIEHAQIHGDDWEKSMDQLAREKKYLEEHDLDTPQASTETDDAQVQMDTIEENTEGEQ